MKRETKVEEVVGLGGLVERFVMPLQYFLLS